MISVKTWLKHLPRAALMPAAMMAAFSVQAAGTGSGTPIDNTASVVYDVASVTQPVIESSPTGNSTPGAGNGTATTFVVDNMVDLSVAEIGGAADPTTPGFLTAVTTFRVTNEGNTAQDYALSVVNLTNADGPVHGNADTSDMVSFQIFVDGDDDDAYTAGADTGTFIASLAPDADIEVFVVAEAPVGVTSADFANIRLTATTHDAGSGASALTTATAGADTSGVDVVFADGPTPGAGDGAESADDGYSFISANLTISKTSTVIEDPFNGTTDPKAVPGAFVQFAIALENTGTVDADAIVITDMLSTDVIAAVNRFNGGTSDIEIQVEGGATTYCTLAADADGCTLAGAGGSGEGGTLTIDEGTTIGTAAASNEVTVLFQVEIR